MKNLFLILLFIVPLTATAQQHKNSEINYYLQKSVSKKKTGNALLLSGTGLILTGIVVGTTAGKQNNALFFSSNQIAGAGIFSLGVFSALTSIPFYISANHNKKKSLKISPTTEIIQTNSISEPKNYASAGLKITF